MLLDDNRIKHWILSNKVMCTTAEDRAEQRAAASLPFKQLSAPGVIECLWLDGTEKKKKKMLFQPTDNMSVLAGFTERQREEWISICLFHPFAWVVRKGRSGKSSRAASLLSPQAHICKYNASYVCRARAEPPPTAPLSRALIVILA